MKPVELRITSSLIAALLVAACDSDPIASDPEQSQIGLAFASLASAPHTGTGTAPHTIACPAGGRIVLDGEHTRASDGAGSIVTWNRSTTFEGCMMDRPGGTAIADGQMQSVGEARFGEPVDQVAPIIYHRVTQTGSLTTTFNGTTQTCAYDLDHTFEVDGNRYRITGTACGRQLNLTVPAQP